MTVISERIARMRESARLGQRAAADLAGLSQATWSRIESGEREPQLGEVAGIAAALGCLTSTILGDAPIGARLQTAMRQSAAGIDSRGVADDLQFLLEVEAELRSAGYLK